MIDTTIIHLTAMRTPDLRDGEVARVAAMGADELRELVDGLSAVACGVMAAIDGIAGRPVSSGLLRSVALEEAL